MFDPFFQVCYRHAIGYLRYLKSRGYRLPLDHRTDKDPLTDLAIDVLGTFLQSKKGKPFFLIFDFFTRRKIRISAEADKEMLLDHLLILLRGHISQEIFGIRSEQFPQVENLKRRFRETTKPPLFTREPGKDGNDLVSLASESDKLRQDKPLIPLHQLLDLVHRAAMKTVSRSDWCLQIFESLKEMPEFKNCLQMSDLLAAVVRVNSELVEIEGMGGVTAPLPVHVENEIALTRQRAVEYVQQNLANKLIFKKRLTPEESERLVLACDRYLADLGASGNADKLPEYFRESMPPETHDRYLKEYKYLFESIVESALGYFRSELRKNPIIRAHGHYIKNEE